jgi:signal transduction histidine kinase
MMVNLISNAIKFSNDHSVIHVRVEVCDDGLCLEVKDQGIGISEEDKRHLFERFFRGKNAQNIQGTGLGLNIITKYLELLNGTIHVDSELNVGTTFRIQIPQKK